MHSKGNSNAGEQWKDNRRRWRAVELISNARSASIASTPNSETRTIYRLSRTERRVNERHLADLRRIETLAFGILDRAGIADTLLQILRVFEADRQAATTEFFRTSPNLV